MKTLTQEQVVSALRSQQGGRNFREYARLIGISAAYLNDTYKGNRVPGKKVLDFLGIRRERVVTVTYFEAANGKTKK